MEQNSNLDWNPKLDQNQIWTKIPNFTPFRSGEKNKKMDQNMKQNSKIGIKFKGQNSIFGSESKVEQKQN